MADSRLLVGVHADIDRLHTIIVSEEADGRLRLLGENRRREAIEKGDAPALIERVRQSVLEAMRDAQAGPADLLAMGIVSPGQIDYERGILLYSAHFNVRNMPFTDLLGKYFNCHITLVNDVIAHAVGEQRIGSGVNVQNIVYLYASYGIGACLITDGKVYTGTKNLAVEFGHSTIDFTGPPCPCGSIGCLEVFASKPAMGEALRVAYQAGQSTVLSGMTDLSKKQVDFSISHLVEAIDREDALAIQVVKDAAEAFGAGIANLINFLNPQMIILGGSITDEIDLYFEHAVASAKKRALPDSAKSVIITRGMLGTTAGAYGAAIFAKQHLHELKIAM